MGKKREKRTLPRRVDLRAVEPEEPEEPEVGDNGTGEESDSLAEIALPPRLAPEKDEDGRQVYFRNQDTGDIQSVDRENYLRLQGFISQQPDRGRYGIIVYRMVKQPGSGAKREYQGIIDLPQGLLDEAIRQEFGGGEYYWQLAKDGSFASRADLPADMTDSIKMVGSLHIAGEPVRKNEVAAVQLPVASNPGTDAVIDLLKDQIKTLQKDTGSGASAMVQLMTVMMAGMQQQQQQANSLAQQQTQFMMQMMTLHDKKSEQVSHGKEALYKEIIELMKTMGGGGGGGEPDSFGTALLKAAPGILDKLGMLPGLANVSPRKAAPALPPALPPAPVAATRIPARPNPAPAPAQPAQPVPVVTVPADDPNAFDKEDEPYLMEVVSAVWTGFKDQKSLDETCVVVANLGTDEQLDKLLLQDNDWVSRITATAWAAFQPGVAIPEGLLAYARAVHVELCREESPLPEGKPQVEVSAVPTAEASMEAAPPALPVPDKAADTVSGTPVAGQEKA